MIGGRRAWASGSVVEAHKGDQWGNFEDLDWLRELAKTHCIACVSGDIHANESPKLRYLPSVKPAPTSRGNWT